MRTSTFVSIAFATLTLAAPSANPDPLFGFTFGIGVQQNKVALALSEVTKSVNQLNIAIKAVKSFDLSALAAVAKQGQTVGTVIKAAEANIEAAPAVDNLGAIAVQNSARALAISINNVATSLIAKKAIVQKAGLSGSVVQMLQNQQAANSGLSKAVLAKVSLPASQQSLQADDKVVAQSLNRVVMAFSLGTTAARTGARRIPQPTGAVKGGARPLTTASPKVAPANSRGTQPVAAAQPAAVVPATEDPKKAAPVAAGSAKPATAVPATDNTRTPTVAASGSVAAPAVVAPAAAAPAAAAPAAKASPANAAAAPAVAAPAAQKGTTTTAGVTGSAEAASVASN